MSGPAEERPIRIGISACLLGQPVRYDANHKRDPWLVETFGSFVSFVPVCPEVEIGLGIPREPIHLETSETGVRLISVNTRRDLTQPMRDYAAARVSALAGEDLSGYVLKKDSPTCGVFQVKVYPPGGRGIPSRTGRGLFADRLVREQPLLPVEEEGRLHDPALRENFVERVFAFRRVNALFEGAWTAADLMAFHAREKLLLMAHEPRAVATLGRIVAATRYDDPAEASRRYREGFMAALARIATPRKHANVLQHMAGYLKRLIGAADRAELQEVIEDHRRGLVPLIVPMTLLRHHVRAHGIEYLAGQSYLSPHPKELMLRNHV